MNECKKKKHDVNIEKNCKEKNISCNRSHKKITTKMTMTKQKKKHLDLISPLKK